MLSCFLLWMSLHCLFPCSSTNSRCRQSGPAHLSMLPWLACDAQWRRDVLPLAAPLAACAALAAPALALGTLLRNRRALEGLFSSAYLLLLLRSRKRLAEARTSLRLLCRLSARVGARVGRPHPLLPRGLLVVVRRGAAAPTAAGRHCGAGKAGSPAHSGRSTLLVELHLIGCVCDDRCRPILRTFPSASSSSCSCRRWHRCAAAACFC